MRLFQLLRYQSRQRTLIVTTSEDQLDTTDAESQTDADIRLDLAEDRCGIELGAKEKISPHHT